MVLVHQTHFLTYFFKVGEELDSKMMRKTMKSTIKKKTMKKMKMKNTMKERTMRKKQ